MKDQPFNLINPDSVREYLTKFSNKDQRLADYLCIALEKPLRKRAENISLITEIPDNPPQWLTEKWDVGKPFHIFDPHKDLRLAGKIGHITDWMKAALINNSEWVDCVDDKNRPLKLLKISSIEQAEHEANKAMKIAAQHMTKEEVLGSTQDLLNFSCGYKIVTLLTPEALDRESAYLGHCIGDGAYDEAVLSDDWSYVSLRDERNIPHATMEISINHGILMQCKGKQNTPPVSKYVPYIKAFVQKYKLDIEEDPSQTGLIKQGDLYFDIFNLPADFEYNGNLSLGDTNRQLNLPLNLSVKGSLNLWYFKREITLPDGMMIDGDLELPEHVKSENLPEGLHIKGDLSVSRWDNLKTLPTSLRADNNIRIVHCPKLETIPDNLSEINGGLSLSGCKSLKTLPSSLMIRRKDKHAPSYSGELNLTGCISLEGLPENLYVEGPMYINGCKKLKNLPSNISVAGNIFTDFGIFNNTQDFIKAFKDKNL